MTQQPSAEKLGLLLSDDFMWTSRVVGTAQSLGLKLKAARSLDQLEKLAREQEPACVILDLGMTNLNAAEVVQLLKSVCPNPPRFTAYGSHVDVASLRAAREAGCDPVLPRSSFAEQLPALLKEWLS